MNKNSDESIKMEDIEKQISDEKDSAVELEKITSMAEETRIKIFSLQRRSIILVWLFPMFSVFAILALYYVHQEKIPNEAFFMIIVSSLFIFLLIALYLIFISVKEQLTTEKRAIFKISKILQEILPYEYKNMSILERTRFEIRLAKLNIVIEKKDKN